MLSPIAVVFPYLALAACDQASQAPDDARVTEDTDVPDEDTNTPEVVTHLTFEPLTLDEPIDPLTSFRFLPGSMDFLALTKDGHIVHATVDGDEVHVLGSTQLEVFDDLDCGAISLAIDPNYATTHHVFVSHCFSVEESVIVRVTWDDADYESIPESAVEIFRAGFPGATRPWHNVGAIGFEPSGVLWALFGEKVQRAPAADLASNLGAIVRLVPRAEGGATPALDNPYVEQPDASPFVYAKGLRSPWTGVRDHHGFFWVGDVGEWRAEEIDLATRPGVNFGWPMYSGPCPKDCGDYTNPIMTWGRSAEHPYLLDDEEAIPSTWRVSWVGVEYRGALDRYEGQLTDQVLFGDACIGFVRAAEVDDEGEVRRNRPVGHLVGASSWNEAADGYLYVASLETCRSVTAFPGSGLYRAVLDD